MFFSNCKTLFLFFIFFHFDPSYFYQCIIFSCFVQIEWFKLVWNFHLQLYKSFWNSKGNRVIFKDFLRGSKICYELFDRDFSIKMTSPTSRGHKIFASSPFLPVLSVIDFLFCTITTGPFSKFENRFDFQDIPVFVHVSVNSHIYGMQNPITYSKRRRGRFSWSFPSIHLSHHPSMDDTIQRRKPWQK